MTVQGMTPAGKNPFGLQPPGKARTRADGNPADPGFASLLATLVPPGALQVPGLLPAGEGEGQASILETGVPVTGVLTSAGAVPAGMDSLFGAAPPAAATPVPGGGTDPTLTGLLAGEAQAAPVATGEVGEQPVLVEVIPIPSDLPVDPVEVSPDLPPPGATEPPSAGAPAPGVPAPGTLPSEGETGPIEAAPPTELEPPPVENPTEAKGKDHEKKQNDHRNNPDLTRGLERAAQVSQAREHRPADAPNSDKFPIPAVTTGPVSGADPVPETGASDLPSSLESLRAERYQPNRLMEAISRALTTTQDGQYKVTLRLYPEHLGEVRMQLQLTGREVHTVMEVASPEARQALESRGDQLRQNLNEAGLTLSGFEVSTGQNRQTARDRRDQFEELFRGQSPAGNRRIGAAAAPTDAIERIRSAGRRSGRLDTMA